MITMSYHNSLSAAIRITLIIIVLNSLVFLVTSQVKPSAQLEPSQLKISLLRMLSCSQQFSPSTATTAIASSQELQSSRVIR